MCRDINDSIWSGLIEFFWQNNLANESWPLIGCYRSAPSALCLPLRYRVLFGLDEATESLSSYAQGTPELENVTRDLSKNSQEKDRLKSGIP